MGGVHALWGGFPEIWGLCSFRGFWQWVLHGLPDEENPRIPDLLLGRWFTISEKCQVYKHIVGCRELAFSNCWSATSNASSRSCISCNLNFKWTSQKCQKKKQTAKMNAMNLLDFLGWSKQEHVRAKEKWAFEVFKITVWLLWATWIFKMV